MSAAPANLEKLTESLRAALQQTDPPFGLPGHTIIGFICDRDPVHGQAQRSIGGGDFAQRFADLAGVFHGALLTRFLEFNSLTPDQQATETKDALGDLRASGLLTGPDADHINQILAVLSDSNRKAPDAARAVMVAAQKYRSASQSPLGITLSNIAVDSVNRFMTNGQAGAVTRSARSIYADVTGAAVGAVVGGSLAGSIGAVTGAVAGGVLASSLLK
jgi:hypothetical protein